MNDVVAKLWGFCHEKWSRPVDEIPVELRGDLGFVLL
jgi:hypothetical protein